LGKEGKPSKHTEVIAGELLGAMDNVQNIGRVERDARHRVAKNLDFVMADDDTRKQMLAEGLMGKDFKEKKKNETQGDFDNRVNSMMVNAEDTKAKITDEETGADPEKISNFRRRLTARYDSMGIMHQADKDLMPEGVSFDDRKEKNLYGKYADQVWGGGEAAAPSEPAREKPLPIVTQSADQKKVRSKNYREKENQAAQALENVNSKDKLRKNDRKKIESFVDAAAPDASVENSVIGKDKSGDPVTFKEQYEDDKESVTKSFKNVDDGKTEINRHLKDMGVSQADYKVILSDPDIVKETDPEKKKEKLKEKLMSKGQGTKGYKSPKVSQIVAQVDRENSAKRASEEFVMKYSTGETRSMISGQKITAPEMPELKSQLSGLNKVNEIVSGTDSEEVVTKYLINLDRVIEKYKTEMDQQGMKIDTSAVSNAKKKIAKIRKDIGSKAVIKEEDLKRMKSDIKLVTHRIGKASFK